VSDDPTEGPRRAMVEAINETPGDRERLEAEHGQVWDTAELQADFDVQGFAAPFIVVTRKSDGAKGSLLFQHYPRFYWGFRKT
jgi:hypothetical protein